MTTPLSPAAQAIDDAAYQACVTRDDPRSIAAAALRAAADQVVPDEPDYMRAAVPSTDWWDKHDLIRSELLTLVAELRAASPWREAETLGGR
jgi:hypothetical protein